MSGSYVPVHAKIRYGSDSTWTLRVGGQVITERNTFGMMIRVGNNPRKSLTSEIGRKLSQKCTKLEQNISTGHLLIYCKVCLF